MKFHSFRAILEQPYTIDYVQKKVELKQPSFMHLLINDITLEGLAKALVLWCIVLAFGWLFGIPGLSDSTIFLFLLVYAMIFNVIYLLLPNNKFMVKAQLLSEEPLYWWFFWKHRNIHFRNKQQIIIHTNFYFKYRMLFYGACKKQLETIRYVHKEGLKRLLVITFKQPTGGQLKLSLRGKIKKVEAFNERILTKQNLELMEL